MIEIGSPREPVREEDNTEETLESIAAQQRAAEHSAELQYEPTPLVELADPTLPPLSVLLGAWGFPIHICRHERRYSYERLDDLFDEDGGWDDGSSDYYESASLKTPVVIREYFGILVGGESDPDSNPSIPGSTVYSLELKDRTERIPLSQGDIITVRGFRPLDSKAVSMKLSASSTDIRLIREYRQ